MRRGAIITALLIATITTADARPQRTPPNATLFPFGFIQQAAADIGAGRPAGAPSRWCGFWLRIRKGLSDETLNKVSNWKRWGSRTSCHPGAVVILRPSHVGEVVSCEADGPTVLSGNHGHRVGVGKYPARRVVAYRN